MSLPEIDAPTPYASAAMLYRAADWAAPIPVRGKYPPPTGWTGAEGSWPSTPDVYAWTEQRGHDNIALRLPPTVIGIDVDNYDGKPGAANLQAHIDLWGPLPDTWRSTSRTDEISGIRLYRIPENPSVQWASLIEGGGIELVRWDHRYAMVWPSVHPKTGRVYRWTRDNLVTITTIPRPEELPFLPAAWILGLIKGAASEDHKVGGIHGPTFVRELMGASDEPCAVMNEDINEAIAMVAASGSRHDTMRDAQLDLIRTAESGHPGAMAAMNRLGQAFVNLITDRDDKDSIREEFLRAMDGGAAIVAGKPTWPVPQQDPCTMTVSSRPESVPVPPMALAGAAAQIDDDGEPVPLHPLVQDRMNFLRADRQARALLLAEDHPLDALPVSLSLTEFLAIPDEPVIERIGGLLPIGARVVLAAQMKAGKTTLVGNLIACLADGRPFLGSHVITPPAGKIVLLDNEMDERTLRRWLRDLAISNTDAVRVTSMIGRIGGFDIRVPRIFDHWVKTLAEMDTTVLIVDCLKPILDVLDLDERAETGKITTPLTRLKVEAGISELILVHHMGHTGERSRGDSALRGWPEAEWQLVSLTEPDAEPDMNAPRFFKAYGRDVNVPEVEVIFDPQTRRLSTSFAGGSRQQARGQVKEARLQQLILEAVTARPGINSSEVTQALTGRGGWGRKGDETKMLTELVSRQMLRMQYAEKGAKRFWINGSTLVPLSPQAPSGGAGTVCPPALYEGGVPGGWGDSLSENIGEGGPDDE